MDKRSVKVQQAKNYKRKRIAHLFYKTVILFTFYASYSIYLYWRFSYTIPKTFGYISLIAAYMLFIAEAMGFLESSMFYLTLWDIKTPKTPEVGDKEFPNVDIFIATYNEPEELLYKTLVGCKNMDYPNKEKVHIYICDDGKREEIKKLCESLNIGYITRNDNAHAKAGNLNNALSKTDSPYVVTFDADMIPMHDFLLKTIPFFMQGEKIGFVQVPQNFYNADPFQYNLFTERTIPNEQNLFSRLIQAGKGRFNAIIYAGSNTVLSREALNEIGGLVVGTITEDFATGMKIQSRGYKCIYLNEIHASGLSPESLEDLYSQRIRWGRGVIQTFKAFNPLFMKGLNIYQKIMYFSAFSYWYFGIWRLIFFMAPIMFSVFNVVVLSTPALQMLEIWLPMFVFTNIAFYHFSDKVRTVSWSHIYDTILFPQITKGVLKETFGFKMSKFKVTPKENIKRDNFINRFELVRVQIVIAVLSLIGIIKIIYLYVTSNFQAQYIINLFWLVYNLYLLGMAIFFASERPKFRNNERIFVGEEAYIVNNDNKVIGKTVDISETGVSIKIVKPMCLEPDKNYTIGIKTARNSATFLGKIVRVDNFKSDYKYVFNITDIDKENFSELILILYDRVPPFPEKQKRDFMLINIFRNIRNRRKRIFTLNRKLPRVKINRDIKILAAENETSIRVLDFNYMYIAVEESKKYDEFTIPIVKELNISLHCIYDKTLSDKNRKDVLVYKVANYNEFINYDLVRLLNGDVEYKDNLVNDIVEVKEDIIY
ncbi:glycosyltransferase [Clostridium felsineum]|uniref:glycosyltransferase family 2 protein n=1 Tax=Clostridium felsineum TaxID=36839 RepID=UPI00214D8AED|nr:glycosyltransferase family 2 protein [Clostridium felsineum]MCR3759246.1 glycosyltransferase [Clostridium felsineum]